MQDNLYNCCIGRNVLKRQKAEVIKEKIDNYIKIKTVARQKDTKIKILNKPQTGRKYLPRI